MFQCFFKETVLAMDCLYTQKNVLLEFKQTTFIKAYLLLKKEKPIKQLADMITYLIRNPYDNHTSPNYVSFSA